MTVTLAPWVEHAEEVARTTLIICMFAPNLGVALGTFYLAQGCAVECGGLR